MILTNKETGKEYELIGQTRTIENHVQGTLKEVKSKQFVQFSIVMDINTRTLCYYNYQFNVEVLPWDGVARLMGNYLPRANWATLEKNGFQYRLIFWENHPYYDGNRGWCVPGTEWRFSIYIELPESDYNYSECIIELNRI
jgi:hypothetical protein